MPKAKTLGEAYNYCSDNGQFRKLSEVNKDKINSLIENAEININSANILIKSIKKEDKEWMSIYILYYGALRMHVEALLLFDKIEILNHQCLFAYLCKEHSELELDWNFFEKVRTKRNGINYYGESISYDDWKSIDVQIKLYLSVLKKKVKKQ